MKTLTPTLLAAQKLKEINALKARIEKLEKLEKQK